MEQRQREEVIRNFRSEHLRLLVATDVAARGLSVSNVSHVFNYHLPFDPNSYIHRIGRTGRAGNKGIASTLLTSREWRDFQRFEKTIGTRIQQRDIPNLTQVRASKRQHMIDKILGQKIHEETEHLLQMMKDVDLAEISSKLISMLIGQQVIVGPDRIGLERRQGAFVKPIDDQPPESRQRRGAKSFNNFKSSKPFSRHKREGGFAKKSNSSSR